MNRLIFLLAALLAGTGMESQGQNVTGGNPVFGVGTGGGGLSSNEVYQIALSVGGPTNGISASTATNIVNNNNAATATTASLVSATGNAVTTNDTRLVQLPYLNVGTALTQNTNSFTIYKFVGSATNSVFYRKAHLVYTNNTGEGAVYWNSGSIDAAGVLVITNAANSNNEFPLDDGQPVSPFPGLLPPAGQWTLSASTYAIWSTNTSTNTVFVSEIIANTISASTLSGSGSNITDLPFVKTNETRAIVNTAGISSSNTITASNFVSGLYLSQTTPMLALNYYAGSTNYLRFQGGQLAFAPTYTGGPDNGIAWGGSYMRFGQNTDLDALGYGLLVRPVGSTAFEQPTDFSKMRIGDDHRLDQMMELTAGTIPGAEADNLSTYGFGHWWQKQRSQILSFRTHGSNDYYNWVGLQAVNPDESTIYWLENGSTPIGAATLRAYWSLPPRNSNAYGGWQMTMATNIIFEGGKWGFNAFNNFFVTNRDAGSNIMLVSKSGSFLNAVGFTNGNVTIPGTLSVSGTTTAGTIAATSVSGNGSGLTNAVDLIAGSNITITTNANKRSFTIDSTGGTPGAFTNNETRPWQTDADFFVNYTATEVGRLIAPYTMISTLAALGNQIKLTNGTIAFYMNYISGDVTNFVFQGAPVVADGSGITNLIGTNIVYYTNAIADMSVIDMSKPYAAISTNNNFVISGLSGLVAAGNQVQWATRFYTNTSGSTKTITVPAAWVDIGSIGTTIYNTNQGVLSVTRYPGFGTNFVWRGK